MEVAEEEQEVDRLMDIPEELPFIGSMATTISVLEAAVGKETTVAMEIILVGTGVLMVATEMSGAVVGAMLLSKTLEQGEVGQDVIVAVVVRLRVV